MKQETFKALTLSYHTAGLHIREAVSFDDEEIVSLQQQIIDFSEATDLLILSTCNRTEVYFSGPSSCGNDIIKLISIAKGQDISHIQPYFRLITDQDEAVAHLFRVSMGLDSQVVGDLQISNQVKNAYQRSADANIAGPFLHRLMHTIFFTNKRVVQETPFRDGAASVSYATVELIEHLTTKIQDPKVLILGLGEMGSDVARNLNHMPQAQVFVCNRTYAKADIIARECGHKAVPFQEHEHYLQHADVVVSSVRLDTPFVTPEKIGHQNLLSFKYLIDMSVPRSIDPEVEKIPGIVTYNLDQIQNKTTEALEKRIASIPQVEKIVDEALLDFKNWAQEMEVSPVIHKLKAALEQIRKEEIDRHIKHLSDSEMEHVETITKNIMQKIMKLPVLQLKAACKRGEAETLIDVLNDLFNLESVQKAN